MILNKIKVLIADDHPLFRSGLKAVLDNNPELEVIAEVGTGNDAVNWVESKDIDVIIMDINMPELDGIEATKQIKKANKKVKIILLTMYSDEAYLKEGIKAGASGYILKKAVDTELLAAIRIVLNGENYIYPTLIPNLFKSHHDEIETESDSERNLDDVLSQREREVLKYIALGYTHQEIANILFLSVKTVDTYKSRIMEKLNVNKRSELVRMAIKHNLIHQE